MSGQNAVGGKWDPLKAPNPFEYPSYARPPTGREARDFVAQVQKYLDEMLDDDGRVNEYSREVKEWQMKRQKKPEKRGTYPRCSIQGCRKKAVKDGMCEPHAVEKILEVLDRIPSLRDAIGLLIDMAMENHVCECHESTRLVS